MGQTGTLVGAQVQDTTTTVGTGAITLAGVVPASAPGGSTTFAQQFGATPQAAPGNTFYAIIDGAGNIEVGLGTFNGSTTLTRDYILGTYSGGLISLATQVAPGTHLNFAAGTKNVYSNPNLLAVSVAAWCRIPDDNAANIFQDIMSGTFTGTLTNTGTTPVTLRYKVTNEGCVVVQCPVATVINNAATGPVTVTGVPSFLSNVLPAGSFSSVSAITFNGASQVGLIQVTSGATPIATGTYTIFGQVAATLTSTVTTATNNGFQAGSSFIYPLF